jgi:hypothetical protein
MSDSMFCLMAMDIVFHQYENALILSAITELRAEVFQIVCGKLTDARLRCRGIFIVL